MANTRNIALNVLLKIENEGAYSNIALNNANKRKTVFRVLTALLCQHSFTAFWKEESRLIILSGLILKFR